MRTLQFSTIIGVTLGGLMACSAAIPPQDLISARTAYSRASNDGSTSQVNPRDMDTARKQLAVAEAAFEEDGDTQATRDQAYLALRKVEFAEAVARTAHTDQAKGATVDAMHDAETKTVAATAKALAASKSEVAAQDSAIAAQNVALATGQASLKDEKARRLEAEKRAAKAMADLAAFASVKQEPRGMVITLSGGVLFASAKWELLPAARVKLNQVAEALIKEDPLSKIVVEGHTDSQGGTDFNQKLSEQRAEAVREYLVSRGIAADRLTSEGFGFQRSIADNKSPEGRANNRRVEIVVKSN